MPISDHLFPASLPNNIPMIRSLCGPGTVGLTIRNYTVVIVLTGTFKSKGAPRVIGAHGRRSEK